MSDQKNSQSGNESNPLRTFVAVLFAFLVLGVLDLVAGHLVPGPELDGMGETLAMASLVMGSAALAGLLVGFGAAILMGIGQMLHSKKGQGILLFAAGVAGFMFLNQETFEGAAIKSHARISQIKIVFYVGGVLGLAIAVWASRRLVLKSHKHRGFGSLLWAVLGLVVAQGLLWQNVLQLPGLYWMLHTQLAIVAVVVLAVFCGYWWSRPGKRNKSTIVFALALVVTAIFVRGNSINARVSSASMTRGLACREFRPQTARLFDKIRPAYKTSLTAPPIVDLPKDDKEANAKAEAYFQGQLGDLKKYNVVLISLDTLRADHCGFNGYDKHPTTTNLDELAKDAFVFRRAYSTYPTSSYSYSSALTGLLARSTPVYGKVKRKDWEFGPNVPTPGLFAGQGWKTIGVSAFNAETVNNDDYFGLLRLGFEIYNPDQQAAQLNAEQVTRSVNTQLEKMRERPFFLWAHYLDPHTPYKNWEGHNFGESKIERYDSDISYADHHVGEMIKKLKAKGDFDKTIFVMFSDHGEEFFEHGGWHHNSSIYEEQVHVPFVIKVPGIKGRDIDTVVSLADLHPTLTALLGLSDPVKRQGKSLLPTMLDQTGTREGIAYVDHFYFVSRKDYDNKSGVIMGDKKLIKYIQRDSYEMYDLSKDAKERRSLIGRDDALYAKLAGNMAAFDREIESYHLSEGEVLVDPKVEFRKQVDEHLQVLLSSDPKKASAAFRAVNSLMFVALGNLSPDANLFYETVELEAIANRVIDTAPSIKSSGQRILLIKFVADLKFPSTIPGLEKFYKDKSIGARVAAALGLGEMGVESATPYLLQALNLQLTDPSLLTIALARLGRQEIISWITPTLMAPSWGTVGEMVTQLPYIQLDNMGFYIRDLLTEGRWRPRTVQAALAQSLATTTSDEDMKWMLLLLSGSPGTDIRDKAHASLLKAGMSKEEIAKARKAVDLELDGTLEIKNRVWDQAFKNFRASLATGTYYNPGLRLRLARYLHLTDKKDEAKEILEGVAKNAPNKLDRDLAQRRLEQLQWPARIMDPSTFGLEVVEAKVPDELVSSRIPILFPVRIKNTGSVAIQGGYWQHPARLLVTWVDKDGVPHKKSKVWDNFLPPKGINPGEEITLPIVALPPHASKSESRLVISFKQPWLKLENSEIYRHEPLLSFAKGAKKPKSKKPTKSKGKETGSKNSADQTGSMILLDTQDLPADTAFGVTHSIPHVFINEADGFPRVSEGGLVELADDGEGFFYASVLGDHVDHKRPGVLHTNNWGDIEAMCLASQVVEQWHKRYPNGPRLGLDEISAQNGGFPDYNGDGISDHKTHQSGHNVNFLFPTTDAKDKTIDLGQQHDDVFDPLMFRELMDLFIDTGAYRFTTNTATRIADPTLEGGKYKWIPKVSQRATKSPTFVVKGLKVQLILKTGLNNHSDHVNVMFWKHD
ncbi:MAG: arylsulfatase A-like enzyme/HEAT repeat protein [Planctomycetota bacterium]|jgi:arylsulfatase A-like enzyme/HEAT repeat protein